MDTQQLQLGIGTVLGTNVLAALAVAAIFCLCTSAFPVLLRPPLLCATGLVAAICYFGREFPGFLLVILAAYGVALWVSRQSIASKRWRGASIALVALIAIFTLGRLRHWERVLALPGPAPLVFYSLDMWLTLRLVTLLWEVGSGAAVLSLPMYLGWVCLPVTLAGPLVRYSQLPATLEVDRTQFRSAQWWTGLASGAGKMILAAGLNVAEAWAFSRWPGRLEPKVFASFLAGPLGFYLSTAGYFQLMQFLGRPCGFAIPNSFNFPIGRENISAFWMNWNMTATFVFRDYLFYNRWGLQGYNVFFNTILLFGLVGLWHAANAYWVLWGLLHGVLFCVFLLWRKYRDHLAFLPFRGTPVARAGSRILTYVSVCACWYIPSKILQRLVFA